MQPLNFLYNFFSVNLWKVNFEFFYFSYIAMMLRWFLYFRTALKTWSLLLSKLGLRFSYFGIFKIFTIFEKNSFSSSAVLDSLLASVLSYKYLFFNLDFGIISLGRYLVTKNIWLSRSYFFFIEGNKFKASMAVLRTFSNSSSLLGKTSLYNLFIIGTQIYHCFIRKIIVRPIN